VGRRRGVITRAIHLLCLHQRSSDRDLRTSTRGSISNSSQHPLRRRRQKAVEGVGGAVCLVLRLRRSSKRRRWRRSYGVMRKRRGGRSRSRGIWGICRRSVRASLPPPTCTFGQLTDRMYVYRHRPPHPRPPNLHLPHLPHRPSHLRPRTPANPHHPRHPELPFPRPAHPLNFLPHYGSSRGRGSPRHSTRE